MRHFALLLALLSGPAIAAPFSGRGYLEGCDGDASGSGCRIVVSGVILHVRDGDGTNEDMMDLLWSQAPVTAVSIAGDMGELGDISAPLVLTSLSFPPDDPFQSGLRALQGDWRPVGEAGPFVLRILGLEWQEWANDELIADYLMTPSKSCADGVAVGGTVLSLRQLGGAPDEAACWQIESASDTALTLRDLSGARGAITYVPFED